MGIPAVAIPVLLLLAAACGGAGSNGAKRIAFPDAPPPSPPIPGRPSARVRERYVLKDRRRLYPGAPGLCWKQLHLKGDLRERTLLLRRGLDRRRPRPRRR